MKLSVYRLTELDKLDAKYPGLLEAVRDWLSQGIAARKIPELLNDKYQVEVDRGVVERYRCRRWAQERRQVLEQQLEMLGKIEADRAMDLRRKRALAARGGLQ